VKKAIAGIYPSPKGHWVGDGFPVRSLFTYDNLGKAMSPFLLLDYAGPAEFAPAASPRGVGDLARRVPFPGVHAQRRSVGDGPALGQPAGST